MPHKKADIQLQAGPSWAMKALSDAHDLNGFSVRVTILEWSQNAIGGQRCIDPSGKTYFDNLD